MEESDVGRMARGVLTGRHKRRLADVACLDVKAAVCQLDRHVALAGAHVEDLARRGGNSCLCE